MAFYFDLYRASPDAPPLHRWVSNLAEPLGSAATVQARIATLFPELFWSTKQGAVVSGSTRGLPSECISVLLQELEGLNVFFVSVAASPPVLRRLMNEFGLNFCCAQESGEMRNPFTVGTDWSA
jgi:hypothetical protein